MFDRTARSASPISTAQPVRGTAWSITDEALDLVEQHVARHLPERGGALITTRDSRFVVDFVVDPRPGEAVNYWHSDALRELLDSYRRRHPRRRYAGTLHSHPGGYAEPSGPDHVAFATTLAENPTVRESLFPIVVGACRSELGRVLRLGTDHLVDLPSGTLAGYSAVPLGAGVEVRPAPLHVVPLRAHADAVARELAARTGAEVTAGVTAEIEVEGRFLPSVTLAATERGPVTLVFPEVYPTQAPMVLSAAGLASPAWVAGADPVAQLATAVSGAWPVVDLPGDGLTARLHHHLPEGVRARYLVVGAGSVGSNAAEMLVRSGVKRLSVLDFDVVEAANLSRTVFERADLGRPKVEALAERLRRIAPDAVVTPHDARIEDLTDEQLDEIDVVVLGADDLAAEFRLGHRLYARGIPAVSVKLFERGEAGEVVVVSPSRGAACLRCVIGTGSDGRGETDYGTGRLVAAPALGADIVATVARGVRIALALGQEEGPLADWIGERLASSESYFQHASVSSWPVLRAFRPGNVSWPFDSLWAATEAQPDCPVCGTDRVPPASGRLELPAFPPLEEDGPS